jgi:hypothetical protein
MCLPPMATARYTLDELLTLLFTYTPEQIVRGQGELLIQFEDQEVALSHDQVLGFLHAVEGDVRRSISWRQPPAAKH